MFLKLHSEEKIGYKKLSKADLGLNDSSHQTHIGLFDDVLTFLPNNAEVNDAWLIYEGKVFTLDLIFDRIKNPDSTFRSPKIRLGGKDVISIASKIRDIVKTSGAENQDWFLIWFGLENKRPVFFLFKDGSDDFYNIQKLGLDLSKNENSRGRLTTKNPPFIPLVKYLENIVNTTTVGYYGQLELEVQTSAEINNSKSESLSKTYDIEKVKAQFQETGRKGEELINSYFNMLLEKGEISSYKWYNEKSESSKPYDFHLETKNGTIIYLDVKTTDYGFGQKIIFSSQEIDFASQSHNYYNVYRVYLDKDGNYYLRICRNALELFSDIEKAISVFLNEVQNCADVETIKFAIAPKHLLFENPILLSNKI